MNKRPLLRCIGLTALSLAVSCSSGGTPVGTTQKPGSQPSAPSAVPATQDPNAAVFTGSVLGPSAVYGSGSPGSLAPLTRTALLVVDPATGKTLGQATTDASGNYTASITAPRVTSLRTRQQESGTGETCVLITTIPSAQDYLKMMGVACTGTGTTTTGVDVTPGTSAVIEALARTAGLEKVPEDPINGQVFDGVLRAFKGSLGDLRGLGRKLDGDPSVINAIDAGQALEAIALVSTSLTQQALDMVGSEKPTADDALRAFYSMVPKLRERFVPGQPAAEVNPLQGIADNLRDTLGNLKSAVQQDLASFKDQQPFSLPLTIAQAQPPVPLAPIPFRALVLEIRQVAEGRFAVSVPLPKVDTILARLIPPEVRDILSTSRSPDGKTISMTVTLGSGTITLNLRADADTGLTHHFAETTGFASNINSANPFSIKIKLTGTNVGSTVKVELDSPELIVPGEESPGTLKGNATGQLNPGGDTITIKFQDVVVPEDGPQTQALRIREIQQENPFRNLLIRLSRMNGAGGAGNLTGIWLLTVNLPLADQAKLGWTKVGTVSQAEQRFIKGIAGKIIEAIHMDAAQLDPKLCDKLPERFRERCTAIAQFFQNIASKPPESEPPPEGGGQPGESSGKTAPPPS